MARPLRIEYPGALYHITARGNRKEDIYLGSSDRYQFLQILENTVKRYGWLCHAYCLMNNHYHLLVETPDANLSIGMRQLNGTYTQYFNRSNDSVGHLFQGRFKSILVERESYLLELCRYIVCNPVRAGFCREPKDWKWSSYNAAAYGKYVPDFLTLDWLLSQFSSDELTARKYYIDFVQDGLAKSKSPLDETLNQVVCGSKAFVSEFQGKIIKKGNLSATARRTIPQDRPSLRELMFVKGEPDKRQRNEQIRRAYFDYGYQMKEIADQLGLHYATVSRIIAGKKNVA